MKGKIFNTQEVQAILNGSKVMFREVIKPQPSDQQKYLSKTTFSQKKEEIGKVFLTNHNFSDFLSRKDSEEKIECPYQVGQKIFVKETFVYIQDPKACARDGEPCEIHYKADYDAQGLDKQDAESIGVEFKAATLMPQWASRLTLLIKEIKVERLAEISEEDAIKEGATSRPNIEGYNNKYEGWSMDWSNVGKPSKYSETGILSESDICLGSARSAFGNHWNATHKKPEKKFEASPFCWVVSFEIINN